MTTGTLNPPQPAVPEPEVHKHPELRRNALDGAIVRRSIGDAFKKLNPRVMMHHPVLFVVYVGSIWTTVLFLRDAGNNTASNNVFYAIVVTTLWFVVLFGNFAEALAEGRGKAQADALRKTRQESVAHVLQPDGSALDKPSTALQVGDRCVVEAGELVPGDGDVIEGMALVDESAITGESAPVIRESGGDRSSVTGGTRVLSDHVVVQITTKPGETFIDRMIDLVEGANRQKTPNEIALQVLLVAMTLIFVMAVATLQPFAIYSGAPQQIVLLVALLVALAPTTIGALLSAIGIAGMDRMVQHNVLAMSGRAVEAAGDVSTLLLDKTGTITYGNRMASEFIPVGGETERALAEVVMLSSLADETPEGRSIVDFAEAKYGLTPVDMPGADLVPFTAQTRMSGIEWQGRSIRKGAGDSVQRWVTELGGQVPPDLAPVVERIATGGGTPLVVAEEPAWPRARTASWSVSTSAAPTARLARRRRASISNANCSRSSVAATPRSLRSTSRARSSRSRVRRTPPSSCSVRAGGRA